MLQRFLLIPALIVVAISSALCQSQAEEYNLKAAFIYNFTKYISWPPADEDEFIIGVVGESPISEPLEEIAKTKTINDRKITVKTFVDVDDISFCNILYISRNTSIPLYTILTKVNPGTLTISEQQDYARQGTAFNFVLLKDKLRFESNLRALSAARLKASSQLLKLAIVVD